jgi:hypothetical protein
MILFSIKHHFPNKEDSHKSNFTLREINTLNLQTSIPLELLFTALARRAQPHSQEHRATFIIFLKGLWLPLL